jgi:hypothetical protein
MRTPSNKSADRVKTLMTHFMSFLTIAFTTVAAAAELPPGVDPVGPLLQLGLLDVTKAPSRSIVAAAYSGKVLCFDFTGQKLWEQAASQYFPFDLDVGDIDGDGFDECAVASADG